MPGGRGSVAVADRLVELAVERERPSGEVRPVEGAAPELLEEPAQLLQHLPEQRIAAGVIDGEVKGQILLPRRPLAMMHPLHLVERRGDPLQILGRAAPGGGDRGLDLDPAPHLQRQEQRVRQADEAYRTAYLTGIASGTLGLLMTLTFVWSARRNALLNARAAAEIHREREHLRVTLASIGDGVIVTDPHGRISTLNSVAEELTGWPSSEAVGRRLDAVFCIVNERTRAPVEDPVNKVLERGAIVGLANHSVLLARDGVERQIDDSAAPIRDRIGAIVGVVMIFRDVAEKRRAEHALRPAVVTRKLCGGGNRTARGAASQQILASVLRTADQRRLDATDTLVAVLTAPTPTVPQGLRARPEVH